MATKRSDKLTDHDWSTLWRAHDLRARFDAGIFPIGGGGTKHFRRLERLGLLEFDGWGRDIDREVERDVLCYQLTPKANELLRAQTVGIRDRLVGELAKLEPASDAFMVRCATGVNIGYALEPLWCFEHAEQEITRIAAEQGRDRIMVCLPRDTAISLPCRCATCSIALDVELTSVGVDFVLNHGDGHDGVGSIATPAALVQASKVMAYEDRRWGRWECLASYAIHRSAPPAAPKRGRKHAAHRRRT